jgi:hypothetical protein
MVLDWMFGFSFFVYSLAADETVEKFVVCMYTAQVRTYYPCKTATTSSHTLADLELLYSALFNCLFLHSLLTTPAMRPPASHIWAYPNARQPRG